MKVRDIMTKDMVIADKDDTILEVAKLMRHHNIGCIPVVENGQKVLGVVTDRDIVMNMARFNSDPTNTFAREIASNVVYKVKPDAEKTKSKKITCYGRRMLDRNAISWGCRSICFSKCRGWRCLD